MHPYNTPFVVVINPLNCESQAKPVSMTGLLLTLCTKYKPMCGLYQWWHVVPFLWHTFPIVSCFGQAMLAKCLKCKCKCKARRETFSPQIGVSIVSSPGRCRLIVLCMRKKKTGEHSVHSIRESTDQRTVRSIENETECQTNRGFGEAEPLSVPEDCGDLALILSAGP